MNGDRLQAALAGQYEVRISDWLSRGWDLFWANWGPYVLYTFAILLLESGSGGAVYLIIGAHLACGFMIVALRQIRNERYDFGSFWRAFELFVELFLAGLLIKILVWAGIKIGRAHV